ncbi:MAG TPA: thiamine pyrophosphate-dependent enzyme, partial [Methanobacterium sp.]
LIEKIDKLQKKADNSSLNKVFGSKGDLGVITSGSAFNYVMDVVEGNDLPVSVLKLTFSYPFPEEAVLKFVQSVNRILVVEEVDPVMEKDVLAVLGKNGVDKKVHGKLDGTLPLIYEFNPEIVLNGINNVLSIESKTSGIESDEGESSALPKRPPTLCPGCPHRAIYYAVKKSITDLNLKDVIFPTDIGCYTLGIEAPYEAGDYLLSMGSSIGTGCGFSKATQQKVVSFIGDSTFFHAGIPPLINAVHNKNNLVVVILDNRTTAMTGGQPHPGLPMDGMGDQAPEISIESMVKATGVGFIETINPLNLKNSQQVFKEALQHSGVAVVISKYPCMLIRSRGRKKNFVVEVSEECDKCMVCLEDLSCPAIYMAEDGSISIDAQLCHNCSMCIQACPEKAIKVEKKS